MKCERCNSKITSGELFCSNCGAKIKNQNDITMNIDISNIEDKDDIKDDVKDLFYQPDLEKKSCPVNAFLVILIILLIGGIVYLIFFDNYIIKRHSVNETVEEESNSKTIYYNDISLILTNEFDIKYKDNKLYMQKNGINATLYMINEEYNEILENINEIILKWNEQGLRIDSNKEDSNIYELLGTYKYNNYMICLTKLDDKVLVIESYFNTVDTYNKEKGNIKGILKTVKKIDNVIIDNFMYPEFNLNPIGSQ